MKKNIGLLFSLTVALSAQAGVYTFKIANAPADSKVILTWTATEESQTLNVVNGEARIEKSDFKTQYVNVRCGRALNGIIFLDPVKSLTVNADAKTRQTKCEGELSAINNYLFNTNYGYLGYSIAGSKETSFIKSCDSLYAANKAILNKAKLPANFKEKEAIRLKFLSYEIFPKYPVYHKYVNKLEEFVPNDAYLKHLDQLAEINAAYLDCPSYGEFLLNAVYGHISVLHGGNNTENFRLWVDTNVKDKAVKEYLVNKYVYGRVMKEGLDGKGALIAYFKQNVSDAAKNRKFDELCTKWEALRVGKPSPLFSCPDIDGNTVTLESLRGKYVYIDVWATWCGPCRGEIPHLKKLEEKYHGKDIHFVSLSCDQNKAAWENMVKKDAMRGIQLYLGTGSDFMDKYMINGIPRFILLDREGNIVKANATRPSNPETARLFDELLAKPIDYGMFTRVMEELEKEEKEHWNVVFDSTGKYTDAQKAETKPKMDKARELKKEWARTGIEANYTDKRFLDVLNIYLFNFLTIDELNAMLDKFTPEVQQQELWKAMKDYTIYKPLNIVGAKAFDFTLTNHKGKKVTLSKVAKKNKLVIVDFWASWCGPCRASMPSLKKVYEKYKNSGVEVLSVSIDEKVDAWDKAYRQLALPWIDVCNKKGWKDELVSKYAIRGIPHQVVIDSNMNLVLAGAHDTFELVKTLSEYLGK